ncbi:MAG: VOC family protein [Woeseiaceae bacterium]
MRSFYVFLSLGVLLSTTPDTALADVDPLHPPAPFLRENTFNQNPAEGKLEGRLLRIKRPLFIVQDLQRSLDFYVDVVGLEVYEVEATFNRDPESLGYQMFNIPKGEPKRMATLNTSNEVRGMTLQEVPEMDIVVGQAPRTHTVLFETDDVLGIRMRAEQAGFKIIEPVLGDIPATDRSPRLRFVEFGIVDPDGHVVAFFQYFNDDASWQDAQTVFGH